MNLEKLYEDRFGEFPFKNITWYAILSQVFMFVVVSLYPWVLHQTNLSGALVLSGQWWRLLTFLVLPIDLSPVFAVLSWYMLYIFGTALEQTWGAFRYFLFLLIAYVATIIGAFLFPLLTFSSGYIFASLFLAFAYLNPNFTVLLFFIIPIKVKWLAYLSWFFIAVALVTGDTVTRVQTVLMLANFFIFFGKDILLHTKSRAKYGVYVASHVTESGQTFMKCAQCGATEKNDKIFYTCRECKPERQFCEDHIKTHTHKVIN